MGSLLLGMSIPKLKRQEHLKSWQTSASFKSTLTPPQCEPLLVGEERMSEWMSSDSRALHPWAPSPTHLLPMQFTALHKGFSYPWGPWLCNSGKIRFCRTLLTVCCFWKLCLSFWHIPGLKDRSLGSPSLRKVASSHWGRLYVNQECPQCHKWWHLASTEKDHCFCNNCVLSISLCSGLESESCQMSVWEIGLFGPNHQQ